MTFVEEMLEDITYFERKMCAGLGVTHPKDREGRVDVSLSAQRKLARILLDMLGGVTTHARPECHKAVQTNALLCRLVDLVADTVRGYVIAALADDAWFDPVDPELDPAMIAACRRLADPKKGHRSKIAELEATNEFWHLIRRGVIDGTGCVPSMVAPVLRVVEQIGRLTDATVAVMQMTHAEPS